MTSGAPVQGDVMEFRPACEESYYCPEGNHP